MSIFESSLLRAIEKSEASGSEWLIALQSKSKPANWIDISSGGFQLTYPFQDHPESRVAELVWPKNLLSISAWEPNSFIAFCHGGEESVVPLIARFVEKYTERILLDSTVADDWDVSEKQVND